jgi:hypothetical protein
MTVIDVDTHWESTGVVRAEHPLGPRLDRVPTDSADAIAFGIACDLLRFCRRPTSATPARIVADLAGPLQPPASDPAGART